MIVNFDAPNDIGYEYYNMIDSAVNIKHTVLINTRIIVFTDNIFICETVTLCDSYKYFCGSKL